MTDAAAVRAFIAKWEQNTQKESSAAKELHALLYNDLHRRGVQLNAPTAKTTISNPEHRKAMWNLALAKDHLYA